MLLLVLIRDMTTEDWPAVERIYAQGMEDGEATFETTTPTWDAYDSGKVQALRFVAVDDQNAIVGWVAASAISSRPAYRGVV